MSTAVPLTTYDAFSTRVKDRVFPFGVPENLELVVDQFIVEALILVQRYAPGYQARHVDVVDTEFGTYQSCGATLIARPRGKLHRIVNRLKDVNDDDEDAKDDCDYFVYDRVTRAELESVAADFVDFDTTDCRIQWGNFSEQAGNIAIVPPLRAVEKLEITWSGIKREYAAGDMLPDDPELFRAVTLYVEKENASRYDKDVEAAKKAADDFDTILAEISLDDQNHGIPMVGRDDEDMGGRITFTFVADGGLAGANQTDVASLIKQFNPDVLLFGGDNNYPAGDPATIQANWAAYLPEIERNRVRPALGDFDLDTDNGTPQLSFFSLPGNGRYYRFRQGPVEFFCINSGLNSSNTLVEADGNTQASTQGQWLEAALGNSDAEWKVVYFHHPPYTNSTAHSPGFTDLRWDFSGWGADVVLSGHSHNYERLIVSDFPYFVVGTGGHSLAGFIGSPTAASKKRYFADYGALKVTADHRKMLFQYYNVDRQMVDVYALTK